MRTLLLAVATPLVFLLVGCAGSSDDKTTADATGTASERERERDAPESEETPTQEPSGAESPVGDACALWGPAFLDELMQGETTIVGASYEFQEPLNESPSAFCAWKEKSTGLAVQVTLEPAATSEIDDHTGRAYNIDVDPVVVPQDGPGTSAVLLMDPAFEGSTDGNLAYGYFFVAGDVTVFVESVGLEVGESALRSMAGEAADRLAAG